MKLTPENTVRLSSLISVASLCGIESMVIIDGVARAINPSKTCFLMSSDNVPDFQQKIGLGRLKELQSRLAVFAGKNDTIIDAKESDRGEIMSMEISSGRNKAQYRCQSSLMLGDSIPKSVPDANEPGYMVTLAKEELKTVLDAIKVMGSKRVTLAIKNDNSVSFTASDSSNDNFVVALEAQAERLSEEEDTVVNYYNVDVFSAVLRELSALEQITIAVGERGTLKVRLNDCNLVLLPQINDDDED